MTTRNTLPLILALMIALLTGCSNRAAIEKLAYLETRMGANADSVRTALAAMDGSRLRGEARALHALLYSQAQDKCYIDVTNDSLISIATKYYRKGDEPLRALQSLYYQGRVMENAEEYHQAIALYTEAERYVDEVEDPYIKGLLYAHLGVLHDMFYDYPKSLKATLKALDYFLQAKRIRQYYATKLNVGHLLLNMNRCDEAERYITEVINYASEQSYKNLYVKCIDLLMTIYDITGNIERLSIIHEQYKLFNVNEYEMGKYLSYYYALNKKQGRALEELQKAWLYATSYNDTIELYHQSYKVYKTLGLYDEALTYRDIISNHQDSILRLTLQQPLLTAQRDFFQEQSELTEVKLQKSRQAIFFICVVAILVIAIIIIVSRTRARKKREELDGYVNLTEDLQRSLYSKEETISRMGAQLQQHDEKERTMSTRLADLMRGRYELLNELTNTYYETSGSKADREAIYQKVKKAIDRMAGNRKEMQELESIVNEYCDNAMAHIHAELPELPYDDTVLLCYIYAGFSAKAIHLFTKNSISNIYSRKSRLRDHIRQSDAPHRQQLLDMMP